MSKSFNLATHCCSKIGYCYFPIAPLLLLCVCAGGFAHVVVTRHTILVSWIRSGRRTRDSDVFYLLPIYDDGVYDFKLRMNY